MFILGLLLATACQPSPSDPDAGPDPAPRCAALDTLMATLHAVDSLLPLPNNWPNCSDRLRRVLDLMERNVRQGDESCHYLNQQNYPERPRFLFVDHLADRIRRDTLSEGLYFFVRLRGIFSDDPEISEYFSEELAHVALVNPVAYLDYLHANPDQEVMLLYSTKWTLLDADRLIGQFSGLEGSAPVVDYLRDWKAGRLTGER